MKPVIIGLARFENLQKSVNLLWALLKHARKRSGASNPLLTKAFCPYRESVLSWPGILAEMGSVDAFKSESALAKYAGLVWREGQSGDFSADDTPLSKAGNAYLRYYLIEAASHVKNNCNEFAA